MSDREIVQTLREMEIDIAVDIAGFTSHSRPLIYPSRVAPIQVNYLGFPGTLGADYVDYLVTDRTVVPETQHMHYAERIVYLPDSFMPRDTTRSPGLTPTRESVGLPENE